MQPEAGIAYIDEQGRVVVETAGQWLHEDRRQIAAILGLPEEQVSCATPRSAAPSAGARTSRCSTCWPWLPGGWAGPTAHGVEPRGVYHGPP